MRVAIVCEGSTDYAVLRAPVHAAMPASDLVVTLAHPTFDVLRARIGGVIAAGWTGVRAYLQSAASANVASVTDVLVVQVDADIRRLSQVLARPLGRLIANRKQLARVPELERFIGKPLSLARRAKKARPSP